MAARRRPHVAKITRDAFIYLDPVSNAPKQKFAQCAECRLWVPGFKSGGCVIHGSAVTVKATMSCAFFVTWPTGKPDPGTASAQLAELKKTIPPAVTPQQSGLVDRQVRCENCAHFDAKRSICFLFEKLNKVLPEIFALKPQVNAYGCCNAQESKAK